MILLYNVGPGAALLIIIFLKQERDPLIQIAVYGLEPHGKSHRLRVRLICESSILKITVIKKKKIVIFIS
jgi:hypothetical protein